MELLTSAKIRKCQARNRSEIQKMTAFDSMDPNCPWHGVIFILHFFLASTSSVIWTRVASKQFLATSFACLSSSQPRSPASYNPASESLGWLVPREVDDDEGSWNSACFQKAICAPALVLIPIDCILCPTQPSQSSSSFTVETFYVRSLSEHVSRSTFDSTTRVWNCHFGFGMILGSTTRIQITSRSATLHCWLFGRDRIRSNLFRYEGPYRIFSGGVW